MREKVKTGDEKAKSIRKDPRTEGITKQVLLVTGREVLGACKKGDLYVVKKAVEQGFDINQRIDDDITAEDGRTAMKSDATPLIEASRSDRVQIVRYLIENRADLEGTDSRGNTPLICAAFCQAAKEAAMVLIDAGADVNAVNNEGNSVLGVAFPGDTSDRVEIFEPDFLRSLLDAGADINGVNPENNKRHIENIIIDDPTIEDENQLKVCAYIDTLKVVAEKCDCDDQTAFEIAIRTGDIGKVRELIGRVDLDKSYDGFLPTQISLRYGHREITVLLMDGGADINAICKWDTDLMHMAIWDGEIEIVRELLTRGFDPNMEDHEGSVPLSIACLKNREEIARLLLEHGADPNIGEIDGGYPIDYAKEYNYESLVALLKEHGAN